jgi:DNA repair protein RadC
MSTLSISNRLADLKLTDLNETEKQTMINLSLKYLANKHRRGKKMGSPTDTISYLRLLLAEYKNEIFGGLFLNNKHQIIEMHEMFYGTIDGASVHPRVVVQKALELNAAAVILFHNHPSGVAEPSNADKSITHRLVDALALIDVRVLDHLVVTANESVSFAERGYL